MTATLHYNPYSQHSRKVLVLQAELGLDLELRQVDVRPRGMGGDNDKPEFLQINPNGKVPVLVDGDFTLWESNAITWYLAESRGWSPLWPEDTRERAAIAKWQLWQAAHLSPALDGLLWENGIGKLMGGREPDAAAVEKYNGLVERWGQVLNLHLEGSEYLAVDRFTLADIAVSTAMMHDRLADFSFAGFPHVQAWIDRMRARPSWRATEPPPMPAMG